MEKEFILYYSRMQIQAKTVRVITMSDTHDLHFRIDHTALPPADIFIHAGDFTKFSLKQEHARFRQFIKLLPYKHKIVIAGNHDFLLDKASYTKELYKKHTDRGGEAGNPDEEIQKLKDICTYLEHQSVEVQGIKIFGSPYSLQFFDWGFMYNEKDGKNLWSCIPDDADVVVTHGPPYGIQDFTINKVHAGCKDLLVRIKQVKPQLHVFGHIHQAYGVTKQDDTIYHNASLANLSYKITNKPQVFEIKVRQTSAK